MSVRHLGRALGIIARALASEQVLHDDVSAWYAPSECHDLVSRGEIGRLRRARRLAKSVSGMSRAQFNRALREVPARVLMNAESRIYQRISPFA